MSTERKKDHKHTPIIKIGLNKSAVLKYKFPTVLKHYYETSSIKSQPWTADNMNDCLLKIFTGQYLSYRIPGGFNRTVGIIFDSIEITDKDRKFPFQIILVCKCWVNCTFKGVTTNYNFIA